MCLFNHLNMLCQCKCIYLYLSSHLYAVYNLMQYRLSVMHMILFHHTWCINSSYSSYSYKNNIYYIICIIIAMCDNCVQYLIIVIYFTGLLLLMWLLLLLLLLNKRLNLEIQPTLGVHLQDGYTKNKKTIPGKSAV